MKSYIRVRYYTFGVNEKHKIKISFCRSNIQLPPPELVKKLYCLYCMYVVYVSKFIEFVVFNLRQILVL